MFSADQMPRTSSFPLFKQLRQAFGFCLSIYSVHSPSIIRYHSYLGNYTDAFHVSIPRQWARSYALAIAHVRNGVASVHVQDRNVRRRRSARHGGAAVNVMLGQPRGRWARQRALTQPPRPNRKGIERL
eukprot:1595551-Pleurochrysis_carterae.AAC.3